MPYSCVNYYEPLNIGPWNALILLNWKTTNVTALGKNLYFYDKDIFARTHCFHDDLHFMFYKEAEKI